MSTSFHELNPAPPLVGAQGPQGDQGPQGIGGNTGVAGLPPYVTKASLLAVTPGPLDPHTAMVTGDPVADNNGVYAYVANGWSKSSAFTQQLTSAVQPIADAAQTSANASATSATTADASRVRAQNAVQFSTWVGGLASATGMAAGDKATLSSTDTGTHASLAGDVGASGGQTPNAGRYSYVVGVGPVRVDDLDSVKAAGSATQAGVYAAGAAASLSGALTTVNGALANAGLINGDDIVWAEALTNADGSLVDFGRKIADGSIWSWIHYIQTLVINNGGSITLGDHTIYYADVDYDFAYVGSNNVPNFGFLNGQFIASGFSGGSGGGLTQGNRWAPAVTTIAGEERDLPDGRHAARAAGTPATTRASFDTTEAAYWITTGAKRKYTRMFGQQSVLPGPPMATRPASMQGTKTDAGMSTRLVHKTLYAAGNLQLVYGNWNLPGAEFATIRVSASIEYPSGTYHKVHFANEAADGFVSIPPGATFVSLPVGIDIPGVGTEFYSNTTVIPSSGGSYPIGGKLVAFQTIDSCTPNSAADYTMSAQPSPVAADTYCYGPLAICGIPADGNPLKPIVGALGDSIAAGTGGVDSRGIDGGIIENACRAAGIGYVNLGNNGATIAGIAGSASARKHHMELLTGCTDVVISFGTNDLATGRTVSQLQADYLTIWTALSNRGVRVWQMTVPPRTTSTDSWATPNNQTPISAAFGPETSGASARQQINTWLRTVPSPLAGIIDTAAAVEVLNSAGSWVWAVGMTGDGIHPSGASGVATCAALIPVSLFG